jgi:hypothetical protein
MMQVSAISLRPTRGSPWQPQAAVQALAGAGLQGDMHVDPLSPRQVLLASVGSYARHALPSAALGENLLVDLDTSTLASGALLAIGPEAVLAVSFQCEACGYLDAQLPGLAKRIGRERGALARVLRGGIITQHDTVRLLPGHGQQWPDDWRARVRIVLLRVPDGMVLEYAQLARLAGVQASYCRGMPRVVREAGLAEKAVAKGVRPDTARWDGSGVFEDQP